MTTADPMGPDEREALIDALVMTPMADHVGTDLTPITRTADALIAAGDWLYIWDPANPDTACVFHCEGRVARYHSTVTLMPLLWEGDQN